MSDKVEGTIILDGLLQGKVPQLPGTEQRLRDWEQFVRTVHLAFNLEIAGGTFGFLADQTPRRVKDLGHDPAETVTAALGELLKIFPPGERGAVFSTLRSVEYRKGEEVQTLYVIAPDGSVLARGRTVSANTTAPSAPLSLRERAVPIAIGVMLLVLLLFISSLFVDYRGMIAGLRSQWRPLDAPHFPVDAEAFENYFTIDSKSAAPYGQGLILTLHRLPAFPTTQPLPATAPALATTAPALATTAPALATTAPALATTAPALATTAPVSTQPSAAPSSLAAAAVGAGYLRCEFFDENNQFMGFTWVRIKPLRDHETMDLLIPFGNDRRPSSVCLTF